MQARQKRPDLLSMKVRSAFRSSIGSQHDAAQVLRALIPTSCVLLLVFVFAPLRQIAVLSLCAFSVADYERFWTSPVVGSWSLLHLLWVLSMLFAAYLGVAFLVAWKNPKRPTAAEWIGALMGLVVVGLLLILVATIGASIR